MGAPQTATIPLNKAQLESTCPFVMYLSPVPSLFRLLKLATARFTTWRELREVVCQANCGRTVFQRDRCKISPFPSTFLTWKESLQLDTASSMSPAASGVFQRRQHRLQVKNLGKPSAWSCWLFNLALRQRFWDLKTCRIRDAYLFLVCWFLFLFWFRFLFMWRSPVPDPWVILISQTWFTPHFGVGCWH